MPFDMPPKKPGRPPFPTFKQATDRMFEMIEEQCGIKLSAKHKAQIRKSARPQYDDMKIRYQNGADL